MFGSVLFIIIVLIVLGTLVWTTWQLGRLQTQLRRYHDYIGEIRHEVISKVVSEEFLGSLRNQAQLQMETTIKAMDEQLQQALAGSYSQLLKSIESRAALIINGELEQYQQTLANAKIAATNISSETEKQLLELRGRIEQEAQTAVRIEKQQLLKRLDTKLSDIVAYYLLEALGESVDLGSQKDYILSELEKHKDDIKRDINDEF